MLSSMSPSRRRTALVAVCVAALLLLAALAPTSGLAMAALLVPIVLGIASPAPSSLWRDDEERPPSIVVARRPAPRGPPLSFAVA